MISLGAEIPGSHAGEVSVLRAAVLATMWPTRSRGLRCTEIFMTTMCHGHLVDPHQAIDYATLNNLRRVLNRRPALQALWKEVWLTRVHSATRRAPGPVGRQMALAESLQWERTEPFVLNRPGSTPRRVVETPGP